MKMSTTNSKQPNINNNEPQINKAIKPQKPVGPMAFGPRGGMMGGSGEKAKNFKGTSIKLIKYMKVYWFSIILVFVFAIASTVFAIFSPKILGNVTNQIVDDYTNMVVYDQVTEKLPPGTKIPKGTTGEDIIKNIPQPILSKIPQDKLEKIKNVDFSSRPSINFNKIKNIAIILIVLYILSSIFSYIQGWVMTGVSQKISFRLRKDVSDKINRLPLSYLDGQSHGDVLSRVTNDIDTVSQTLNQSLTQIITSITTIIGILIMMFSISWQMTLVALLILPVSFIFIGGIVKKSQTYFKQQQSILGQMNGHIEEMYSGHNVVKVFNGEKESIEKFVNINDQLFDSGWKSQFLSGLMFPIMNFMGNIGYVGIAVLGGWLAIHDRIKIGDIQAFIQYLRQFNQPVLQSANIANVLQSTAAAAERVFEFLDEEEEIPDTEESVKLATVRGEVSFENVEFGYLPDKLVIKGFNQKVSPGQRVAIVGPTGAGKTTMVNLLMRFYDVNGGAIKIDGVDIRKMTRSNLRRMFGMVLQDTWLFHGTIKENLKYGKQEATDAELLRATKMAHVDHFIRSLPNGYDMLISEDADNLSQGEKQLLTIARALLADPPILILDEATSSVDTRTELLIQKAMENLMKGRTSFVIAHRLSTIKNADLIIVMNEGKIIETGNHTDLVAKKGFYSSLYNSQFGS
jgi:ATP-binding cassette, subfamily B, multidrug efflux pump